MIKTLKLHRCCELCLKEKEAKLAEYGVSLTDSGELNIKLKLLCKNHLDVYKEKMKKKGFMSYPFFYIQDHINQFGLRIESL